MSFNVYSFSKSTVIGPTGPTGPAGLQGPTGPTGPAGLDGLQGITGPAGLQGITGPAGLDGLQGITGPAGLDGLQGITGPAGLDGLQGITGPAGPQGPQGLQGIMGIIGITGPIGITGSIGLQGPQGIPGPIGPTGPIGPPAIVAFADFYALMPGDNTVTIAVGSPILFPQNGISTGVITRINTGQFNLPNIGIYEVFFQASVTQAGQLVVVVNGVQLLNTLVGRATGTSQIVGNVLIQTSVVNSIISINNPTGETSALTLTPIAGGSTPVSAHIIIKQLV